jgi:uncharacterized protein
VVLQSIEQKIAEELAVGAHQVRAAVGLLDEGSTVPFIARYRKEVTGELDDAQLRTLEERLRYLRELEERRQTVLESIESQGKLDDALKASILAAETKSRLEDIYLPFKPKAGAAGRRAARRPVGAAAGRRRRVRERRGAGSAGRAGRCPVDPGRAVR